MSSSGPSVRLGKRRRAGKKPAPMAEDDDSALDTAMYKTVDIDKTRQKVLLPVRLDRNNNVGPLSTEPAPEPEPDYLPEADVEMNQDPPDFNSGNPPKCTSSDKTKRQWFYMKEFVSRVDGILDSMQAREALPDSGMCTKCVESVGRWRCQECTSGKLLCRSCMRKEHFSNPFHRIERWTGTYFRRAALWEVGVFLTLNHQHAPSMCPNLQWQHNVLEMFQQHKDKRDDRNDIQTEPERNQEPSPDVPEPDHDQNLDREADRDAATMRVLDQLLEGHNPNNFMEEEDPDGQDDADVDVQDRDAGAAGFINYIQHDQPESNAYPDSDPEYCAAPDRDALNNQYVRVVHTNGVHHIAMVCCTCRGKESIINDIIYAGMLPTSFVRIRTIFTTALLDHFRYCNLELRSSAYQFFQLLRRFTLPMAPLKVANLYHELRRLSRLWRWVKKLRWAGYGLKRGQPINPQPGELGNFCPACPQSGINIANNWREDPNAWAFRRVLTADGNFKADHVRQKKQANDMWLANGSGMTARRSEYNEFLASAQERSTVSGSGSARLRVSPGFG